MDLDLNSLRDETPVPASVTKMGGQKSSKLHTEQARPKPARAVGAKELAPLANAGVGLTKWVLAIIATALALLICITFYQEQRYADLFASTMSSVISQHPSGTPQDNGAESEIRKDIWKAYLDAVTASRDFWIKLDQMVLLNLLLPVLTALLGYVFGLKAASKT